jgi:hypothetical protein
METELTPWQEINPPMASAPRPALPSRYSDLTPATAAEFRNELTACLALVVPSGMTEEARRDWLRVAWATLKHWPLDLLRAGCEAARESCDHPAKVVPAIVETTKDRLERRRDRARSDDAGSTLMIAGPGHKRPVMDRRGQPMSEDDTAELNAILEKLGATARYRPDGSRYVTENMSNSNA